MMIDKIALCGALMALGWCRAVPAIDPTTTRPVKPSPFLNAKTLFQTNSAYDPRIAIAVDGVIVHQHGVELEPLRRMIDSWKQHGYCVGRMFFA